MLKKLTKVLSLLLILCLMVSMFPAVALADEGTEAPVVTETPEETTPVVTPVPEESSAPVESPVPEESSAPVESPVPSETPAVEASPAPSDTPVDSEPVDNTSANGDEPAADDEPASDEPGDYSLTNPDEGVAATSLTMGTKPADGTTTGNPFVQGTGGSNSFRIPAMVTLNSGRIVAAADARWNTTYDGGGLDTIVSYSTDNGANWNYTFANYLGDNGNTYNGSDSTAFIDPALATDGSTVYMLCDLYPYGVALNGSGNTAPSTAVGFNSDGKLLLSTDGSNYNYYLDGTVIKDSSGNEVSGLTVDSYFNVTGTYNNTAYNTNLFFSDSPFKVVRTGYLYLTKSTDGGKTWSTPTLIPNVKTSSEQVCLVGPGRGLVTGGKIIFPVYSYNGSSESQRMGFIYSSNNGASWTRVDSSINWSSEAAVVALKDGTLRFFYRNGTAALCYADYSWTNGWGSAVNTGIATNSNTQISAISLQNTVDGKQVILVSCPTGSNNAGSTDSSASARLNGKIFVGYVNSDNTMSWQSDKAISVTSNNSQFMYSCLTELSDGKVAILYENQESKWGTGDNCYYTMDFQTYDLGLTTDTETKEYSITDSSTQVTVNFGSNEVTSMTVTSGAVVDALVDSNYVAYNITPTNYSGSAKVTLPVGDLDASNGLYGFFVETDGTITKADDGELSADSTTFTFTVPHFSVVGLAENEAALDYDDSKDIVLTVGKEEIVTDNTGNYQSRYTGAGLNESIATVKVEGSDGVSSVQEWQLVTDGVNGINTTDRYLIVSANSGSAYALTSSGGTTPITITNGVISVDSVATTSDAVFTFAGSGRSWTIHGTTGYLYPTATRSWGSWSYSLPSGQNTSQTVTISGTSGVTISRSVTSWGDSTTSYLKLDNTAGASGSSDTVYLFKLADQEASDPSTTITFTGVTAGETQVVVGNTLYNITVNRKTETVNLTVGNPVTYPDTNAGSVTVADGTVAEASLTNGQLTIKGLKEGTTTVTTNTTVYTVTVSDGTPISIKENETTTISVTLKDGQTVKWSSADSNYVGVAGKYDTTAGAYTNEAILAGQNVTSSPVVVTGTVYNADGTVAGVYKWLVTVTEGDADTNTSSKGIYFNIDTIENCTVYYSINGGELIPVNGTGVTTGNWTGNGTYKGHFNIMFFAAPDEGYALTYMSISGSADQYYTLSNGNPDGTGSDAWPFNDANASSIPTNSNDSAWKTVNGSLHGFRWALMEGNMTIDQMKVLFSNAIALGCDGATTITKNANEGMGSASNPTVCKFVAQKLPTVEKTIKSITHNGTETAYTDGMKVEIGDTINYSVVVTRYATNATYGTITYDNEKLTDELTNNSGISNPDMGTSTTSDKTYTYTTSLTLTTANFSDVVIDGKITNTADFSYSYSSQYSAGSLTTEASAVAEITVEIPSYVIDFGLPVVLNLDNIATAYNGIKSAKAAYGDAEVNGNNVTYKPTQTLKGIDYITLTLGNGGTLQVAIYPATTVYYEEGFATYTGRWTSTGSTGTETQAAQIAGQSTDEYGYDAKYAGEGAGPSNGSQATSTGADNAEFIFTGTGLDVYANCTTESGAVNILIRNSAGTIVKMLQVDTKTGEGDSSATDGQDVTSYSLPIASVTGLSYDTYTVSIRHIKSSTDSGYAYKEIQLDGFRVYGTLENQKDPVYVSDLEDNPTYIELRDRVLAALNVNTADSQYASDIAEYTLAQVYATEQTTEGAVVISSNTSYTSDDVQDLLDNGPKNEIFLRQNESLVFTVTTDREVQIGLKAVDSAVTCTVNNVEKTITSSTDMFYTVFNRGGASGGKTVTITNNSGGILSITKLKICDDPGATLGELTEEDLIPALVGMGYELDPEEPVVEYADATLTVVVNEKSTTLTQNGVKGETATFTAAEIEAAAQSLVPDGYELKGQAEAVTVVYGESATVTFSAEEIPTEPEEPEEPEQPTEPEEPEQPSKPANIISAVIRLFDKIFGSLKGLFR
ncbi:MAG: exo-alpha-sialidase [Candidatus Limivicinus sp.]